MAALEMNRAVLLTRRGAVRADVQRLQFLGNAVGNCRCRLLGCSLSFSDSGICCAQVIRSNGEVFAVSHPHKKTGYKALNSETNVRTLGSKT